MSCHERQSEATSARFPPFIEEAYSQLGQRSGIFEQALAETAALWVRLHLLNLRLETMNWLRDRNDARSQAALTDLRKVQDDEQLQIERWRKSLEEEVRRLEGQENELSVVNSTPLSSARQELTAEEAVTLRAVLARLNLLEPDENLPTPDDFFSGIAGQSRVFLFFLSNRASGMRLIAKFDGPDRAKREWEVIKFLRLLNVPAETILPHSRNDFTDGVIIYPVAGSPRLKRFVTLSRFLLDQLMVAPGNCVHCVDLFLDPLRYFYDIEPGRVTDRASNNTVLNWKKFFPEVADSGKLSDAVHASCPELQCDRPTLQRSTSEIAQDAALVDRLNPIYDLNERLCSKTGDIRLSLIHGDLNLTNVLVCPALDGSPVKVNVIDLAESSAWQPTASDLARFEVQFWIDLYPRLADAQGVAVKEWMADFDAGCNYLAGRSDQAALRTAVGKRACGLVYYFRRFAIEILAPNPPDRYILGDYFHCLWFSYLTLLTYRSVRDQPNLVRLALLGASLASQTVHDQNAGAYSPRAARPLLSPCRKLPDLERFD
jgi:hypothetical protein